MHRVLTVSLKTALSAAVIMLLTGLLYSQAPLPTPQPSPKASVSQTIGITTVTITYHRPSVKNRAIWGALVPYNVIWRAGADENTTIEFEDTVTIEGKDLPAGTYGLHMVPTEKEWTIIFSKNSTSWGSFFYREDEDALRVTVAPQPSDFREQLVYEFDDVTDHSATVTLRWEKLVIPIRIDLDSKGIVAAYARNVYLRGAPGFTWQGFYQAASYCLQNSTNLDEAMQWIGRSISINENVNNLFVKAGLLDKLGKTSEADAVRSRQLDVAATEADFNTIGYQRLSAGKTKEAIDIFRKNVKQHPDSWNTYDSLAEAYGVNGDTKLAVQNYMKAANMVKDDANKKRIEDALRKLAQK